MVMGERGKLLLGLVGSGIRTSRAPLMHEREAAEHGIQCIYQIIDLDDLGMTVAWLPELLVSAERMGFSGLNVTHPCKQKIMPLLHELSEDARRLGAVNTVLLRNGKRIGHNTDWLGFAESLRRDLPQAQLDSVVQLGAGGAGAATAYATLKSGAKQLVIFDIEPDRVEHLAETMAMQFGEKRVKVGKNLASEMAGASGFIHATPTGRRPKPGLPLPKQLLRPDLWVAEIASVSYETELLNAARVVGCRTIDGVGMAVHQAVKSFELFSGITPDPTRMASYFASGVTKA